MESTQLEQALAQEFKNLLVKLDEPLNDALIETLTEKAIAAMTPESEHSYAYCCEVAAQVFFDRGTENRQFLLWEGYAPGTHLILVKPGTSLVDALDDSKSLETQIRDSSRLEMVLASYQLPLYRYEVYDNGADYKLFAHEQKDAIAQTP